MTTAKTMIAEATAARDALHREIIGTLEKRGARKAPKAWMAEKIDALGYYNRLLKNLGAIPADAAL